MLAGYEVFSDFVTELGTAPPATVTADQGHSEMFAAGLGATYNNGRWMVPLFREADLFFDLMPHPVKTERAQTLSGSMFKDHKSKRESRGGVEIVELHRRRRGPGADDGAGIAASVQEIRRWIGPPRRTTRSFSTSWNSRSHYH